MPQPCTVVIFGASGDLTFRKLIPALYNLAADGDLPADDEIVGFARREKTDESFRAELKETTAKFSRPGINDESLGQLRAGTFTITAASSETPRATNRSRKRLDELDENGGTPRATGSSISPSRRPNLTRSSSAARGSRPERAARRRVGARDRRETVRHRPRTPRSS